MERKRRTYIHKGKIRYKDRLPRKLKKKRNKEWELYWKAVVSKLPKDKFGFPDFTYFIVGG